MRKRLALQQEIFFGELVHTLRRFFGAGCA